MSEWIPPGHRPHDGHPDDDVRWCECSGRCTRDAPCDCCELAELRAEVERLTAKVEQVKQASAELVAERDRRIAAALNLHYSQCCKLEPPCIEAAILLGQYTLRGES